MLYKFNDGEVYDGPIITLPDGRIVSGATFTPDSRRLFEIVSEPVVVAQVTKAVRARDKNGRLAADDKATPEVNEAWVGGKAPKPHYHHHKKKAVRKKKSGS